MMKTELPVVAQAYKLQYEFRTNKKYWFRGRLLQSANTLQYILDEFKINARLYVAYICERKQFMPKLSDLDIYPFSVLNSDAAIEYFITNGYNYPDSVEYLNGVIVDIECQIARSVVEEYMAYQLRDDLDKPDFNTIYECGDREFLFWTEKNYTIKNFSIDYNGLTYSEAKSIYKKLYKKAVKYAAESACQTYNIVHISNDYYELAKSVMEKYHGRVRKPELINI